MIPNLDKISRFIDSRNIIRHLKTSVEKMDYANAYLFSQVFFTKPRTALYVGIGHGHDAVLAILSGLVESVVGVDPFIEEDGNGDQDYSKLLQMRDEMKLDGRLQVVRLSIQEYLKANTTRFDVIIINDVLHHMFVTKKRLNRSSLFPDVVALFSEIKKASHATSVLIVSERARHGLRPFLITLGLSKSETDYTTKQSERQWTKAIRRSGWKLFRRLDYIPYKMKKYSFLFRNRILKYVLCDKYYLYYST